VSCLETCEEETHPAIVVVITAIAMQIAPRFEYSVKVARRRIGVIGNRQS
jgi:hypothetical protein